MRNILMLLYFYFYEVWRYTYIFLDLTFSKILFCLAFSNTKHNFFHSIDSSDQCEGSFFNISFSSRENKVF